MTNKQSTKTHPKFGTKAEATVDMGRQILAGLEAGNYTSTVRASLPMFVGMVAKHDADLADRLAAWVEAAA
jgi:hypothetical protein